MMILSCTLLGFSFVSFTQKRKLSPVDDNDEDSSAFSLIYSTTYLRLLNTLLNVVMALVSLMKNLVILLYTGLYLLIINGRL